MRGAEPSEDWDFFLSISQNNITVDIVEKILFQWNLTESSQSSNYTKETCALQYIVSKHKQHIIKYEINYGIRCFFSNQSSNYMVSNYHA